MKRLLLFAVLFAGILLFGTVSEAGNPNDSLIFRTDTAQHPTGVWAQIDFKGERK